MHIALVSLLLGLALFAVRPSAPQVVVIRVWPPGTEVYLGDSVVLQCSIAGSAAATSPGQRRRQRWSYSWFRHRLPGAPSRLDPSRRHLASRDTYAITGVTAEDGGRYWCQAEGSAPKLNRTSVPLSSKQLQLNVSGILPPLLSLTPSRLQFFRGDKLAVQCPGSVSNRTAWRLRQLSQDFGVITRDLQAGLCSPLGGSISVENSSGCLFAGLSGGNSGLYWCESDTRRSNAITITVITNATIILKSPYLVSEGDRVVLHCQFWNSNQHKATFFKDGQEVATQSSARPEDAIEMTIENVTKAQEGFYKCSSHDRTMESPESWLSVKCNSTWTDRTDVSTHGFGKWSVISSVAVTFLFCTIPVVWLACKRWGKSRGRDCGWPSSKAEVANADVPKTKQDVTEVQWDLSWMEMSNLLGQQ